MKNYNWVGDREADKILVCSLPHSHLASHPSYEHTYNRSRATAIPRPVIKAFRRVRPCPPSYERSRRHAAVFDRSCHIRPRTPLALDLYFERRDGVSPWPSHHQWTNGKYLLSIGCENRPHPLQTDPGQSPGKKTNFPTLLPHIVVTFLVTRFSSLLCYAFAFVCVTDRWCWFSDSAIPVYLLTFINSLFYYIFLGN